MNILIVGFGGMGCRHTQSILTAKTAEKVSVVESSEEIYLTNLERIGASKDQVEYYNSLEKIKGKFDIAILATSSEPRYEIIKTLILQGIKIFIIEKILFQSKSQFIEIIKLLEENNCSTFCNLPNRYFNAYNEIKNLYDRSEVSNFKMNIIAGDFGLTCNSIHYADIYSYISGQEIKIQKTDLHLSSKPNRRGNNYKELVGAFSLQGSKVGNLNILANPSFEGGVVVQITVNDFEFILYENSQAGYCFSPEGVKKIDFEIIPTSRLTSVIISDILNGDCRLPSVQELFLIHNEFFNAFNPVFGLTHTTTTLCPIT